MAYIVCLLKNGQVNIESRNLSDHEIFTLKIYFNANLERFTNFEPWNIGAICYLVLSSTTYYIMQEINAIFYVYDW